MATQISSYEINRGFWEFIKPLTSNYLPFFRTASNNQLSEILFIHIQKPTLNLVRAIKTFDLWWRNE